MAVLDKFRAVVNSPHQFAQDWKRQTGGKVLGYVCTNLPEELIYAAGVLPVRLLGSNEPEDLTRSHIFQMGFCSYARDCFAQTLRGRHDYVDGIAFALCCPHAREIYNCWERERPQVYRYLLSSPMYLQSKHALSNLRGEIEDFQASLGLWTGQSITSEKLDRAIAVYNDNRRMMRQVYNLLKSETSPLTYPDVACVALAGMLIDKATHNLWLQELLAGLPPNRSSSLNRNRPRLMLLGSVNNDLELLEFIDSLGGRVVIDDYCTGARYYDTEVAAGPDRLTALAGRLIEKAPCPLKDLPARRRLPHLLQMADEFNVQGVIYSIQRLCDAHGLDYPAVEAAFKARKIPMLKLELDFSTPKGQFRTRIEAFLEMMETL